MNEPFPMMTRTWKNQARGVLREECDESPPEQADRAVLRMCGIWEAVLEDGPVQPDDDYFAMGGDSLQALEILSEVQRVFGAKLPMTSFFTAPTAGQLARLALAGVDPDSAPLVWLSWRREGQPLYLLPGAGGNAFAFDHLLRAADLGRPVLGFRLPSAQSGGDQPSTLVEVAGRYVQHLLAFQPEGPYYLAGYSFGGRLSFEMARQLEAAGHPVAFVGLFDTYAPGYPPPLRGFRRLLSHWHAATHPDRSRRRRYFRERTIRVGQRFQGLTHSLWEDRLLVPQLIREDFHYHEWLTRGYVPELYSGRLTLFRASLVPEIVGTDFSDPYLGWGRWAAQGVEVLPVPGDHMNLLQQPHVRGLAASLKACLRR
jgi:aspartate racemase